MGAIFSGLKITNKQMIKLITMYKRFLYGIFTKKHNNRLFSDDLVPIIFEQLFDSLASSMMGPADDIY